MDKEKGEKYKITAGEAEKHLKEPITKNNTIELQTIQGGSQKSQTSSSQQKLNKNVQKKPKKHEVSEEEDRIIQCNEHSLNFPNNSISTSKYTCLTFIPRNLLEQFSKMANIYFLIIGIMQMIDSISISEGTPVIYLPLAVVICISGFKDLLEDYKRHKSDNDENSRKVLAYRFQEGKGWGWVQTQWRMLRVGEMIKIENNEYLPSDILILHSSEENEYCFIETKNLDGETNLKRKKAPIYLEQIPDLENLQDKKPFEYQFQPKNPYLYQFTGKITLKSDGSEIPLNNEHFILRGCSLRNTKYIIGLVSYTGHDTKIMLNSNRAKPKQSKVEREMNQYIIWIFISQIIVCFITAIIATSWYGTKLEEGDLSYLDINESKSENKIGAQLFIKWGTWILIFTNFVPISLLVTVEMVKFVQGIFISQDQYCTSNKDGMQIPATVQASNLNEELGQVEYIFSDKTGTLTANVMKYKMLSANLISYGEQEDKERFKGFPDVTNVDFWDSTLIDQLDKEYELIKSEKLYEKDIDERPNDKLRLFNTMMMIGLCHTIIASEEIDEETKEKKIEFNASSPDELALLNFAKFMGFDYQGIDTKSQIQRVKFRDITFEYKQFYVIEFDSDRKRMSVIVKAIVKGKESPDAWIYCKGADSIILELLRKQYKDIGSPEYNLREQTWNHLEKYASIGLRTLLLAEKKIPKKDFDPWNAAFKSALGKTDPADKILLQNQIETNLDILGATAIEDQLQDKVGQTIQMLKKAGIKIWVLTGDKIETAVNIGYSCKLLDDTLFHLEIDGNKKEDVQNAIARAMNNLNDPKYEDDYINPAANQYQNNMGVNQIQEVENDDDQNANENEKHEDYESVKDQTIHQLTKNNINNTSNGNVNNIVNQNKFGQKSNNIGKVNGQTQFNKSIQQQQSAYNDKSDSEDEEEIENKTEYALLITGDALIQIMEPSNEIMLDQIMKIAHKCKAVMCCRVSPKQKQEVVTMVRNALPKVTTLAIGDGANDVNMITAAHVGIGIRGVEGQQAARSSDFAIGEFKIIRELLLNHGRESYRKNSALICYNFYKNMLLVLPQWWYAFVNGFSGSSNYDPYIYQFYNIFYTSLPIVVYALFDVEYERIQLLKQPKLYRIGLRSELFNKKEFFIWIFFGVWQAAMCGWAAYASLELNFVENGRMNNFDSSGMASFHNSVMIGNLKILLFSYCYTLASFISIFGSIAFFIFTHYLASSMVSLNIYASFEQQYSQGNFWFMNILCIGATIFLDMCIGRYRYYQYQMEFNQEIEAENMQELEHQQHVQKIQQQEAEKRQKIQEQMKEDRNLEQIGSKFHNGKIQESQNFESKGLGSNIYRSQIRSQSSAMLKRSYTGYGFSYTDNERQKQNWQ
ncbi:P-type ATPase, cytoplasmic domain N [Pseudocohnilembus persalinus]|uniref:Phospholipid-transporting ATPase n=1 Tax=Pseudocohnilembus persalinus TaxID=266149 RepID=A0A0V0QAH2_PSEPJ|nr:P-type ATPase, cytoplasmic domain N [Pseudocohnilembus persalinus]|eukprot:KRW99063.1 P-type ATPase, cytoplasmic domain N [Pseudocohnilembus persalinus]